MSEFLDGTGVVPKWGIVRLTPDCYIEDPFPAWDEAVVVRLRFGERTSRAMLAGCGEAGSELDDSLREGIR